MSKIRLLVLLGVLALVFSFVHVKEGRAGTGENVSGFAWSATIGWISFNSTNCDVDGDGTYEGNNKGPVGARTPAPAGCPISGTVKSYGVSIDKATGVFSGYAWSENIGWIHFAPAGPYPTTPNYSACLDLPGSGQSCDGVGNYKVSGWAKALAAADGWDGWIKFSGTAADQSPYGVSIDKATGKFSGFAWGSDVVGWIRFDKVETVPTLFNQAPTIQGNPTDSPDPIKASTQITFTVNWNDPDAGDLTKIHICKTNAISGQTCSGGSWCDTTAFSSTSPTSCNGTSPASSGSQNYYAFVCDDDNACSPSRSGTFFVDATNPTVSVIGAPTNWQNTNATASVSCTDNQGGSGCDTSTYKLKTYGSSGACSTTYADYTLNSPQSISSHGWVCAAARDNAENTAFSQTRTEFTVDKTIPVSEISKPAAGSFQTANFQALVVDIDTGGSGLDANQCKYSLSDVGMRGTATGGTTSTLIDSARNEPEGYWVDGLLRIISGGNAGENRTITAFVVSTHTITVSPAFPNPIAAEDKYKLYGNSDIALGDTARTCSALTPAVSVGRQSGRVCSTEGIDTCQVLVKSKDIAGNTNALAQLQPPEKGSIMRFSIDLTPPVVGPISCSNDLHAPCTKVQQGKPTGIKSLVSDNVQVANCKLQGKPAGTQDWTDIDLASGDFQDIKCPLGRGSNCIKAEKNLTFDTQGTFVMRAQCWDAFFTSDGPDTQISVDTLSVGLEAIPTSGSVNTKFDLKTAVRGTMTGNINYKFDCTNDGTWELEVNNQTQNPYTAVDLCQYPSPGTYTAKVLVERGVGTAESTVDIPVSANSVPSATSLSVDAPNSVDYCGVTGYPPVRVRWAFSDADAGDTQSAYEIEVFQGIVKVVDTGKKLGATQSYVFQSAGEQLLWNTAYTWQVKVWDNHDDASIFASGPQFTTPAHHYPVPNFTWIPAVPAAQESVQFTDQTNFAAWSSSKTWSWNLGDGGTSSIQNPPHTYTRTGAFGVALQSGDNVGSCSTQKTVNISIPFPEWQEISPF